MFLRLEKPKFAKDVPQSSSVWVHVLSTRFQRVGGSYLSSFLLKSFLGLQILKSVYCSAFLPWGPPKLSVLFLLYLSFGSSPFF